MTQDKQELLDSIQDLGESQREISIGTFVLIILIVLLVLALFVPKIYLANQIYYKSRTINKLLDDYEILKEENRLLNQKLEKIRFKTQVLDTIF